MDPRRAKWAGWRRIPSDRFRVDRPDGGDLTPETDGPFLSTLLAMREPPGSLDPVLSNDRKAERGWGRLAGWFRQSRPSLVLKEPLMVSRTLLYGLLAWMALVPFRTEGSEYGSYGGVYPSGLPYFAYGFSGSLYGLGRLPVPPYFAIHPPVYYNTITPRPYGDSPFAWSGRPRQVEASQRRLIVNHFYTQAVETSGPVVASLPGVVIESAPAQASELVPPAEPGGATEGTSRVDSKPAGPPARGIESESTGAAAGDLERPQSAPAVAATDREPAGAATTRSGASHKKKSATEKAARLKRRAERAARKASAESAPATANAPAPQTVANSASAPSAEKPVAPTPPPTTAPATENPAENAAKTPAATAESTAEPKSADAAAANPSEPAQPEPAQPEPATPAAPDEEPAAPAPANSALTPTMIITEPSSAAAEVLPQTTEERDADVPSVILARSARDRSQVLKLTITSPSKPIRNPFFDADEVPIRQASSSAGRVPRAADSRTR